MNFPCFVRFWVFKILFYPLQHPPLPFLHTCYITRSTHFNANSVFGKVIEGVAIVKKIESVGSRSGRPSRSVTIAECGELPSRRQILGKARAEREEEAALRQNLSMVDPDAEARRRLKALRSCGHDGNESGGTVRKLPAKTAQDELRELEEKEQEERKKRKEQEEGVDDDGDRDTAYAPPSAQGHHDSEGDDGQQQQQQQHPEKGDPFEGMSKRQRKLAELQQRMRQARKANESAVVEEKKKAGTANNGASMMGEDTAAQSMKKKWFEEKTKRKQEELKRLGLPEDKSYLLDTAETAENLSNKKEKKQAYTGQSYFSHAAVFRAYEKRADAIQPDLDTYQATKLQDQDFYRASDSLVYGGAGKDSKDAVDRMVAELNQVKHKREQESKKRRKFSVHDTIDYIDDRNAHFNRKIERDFGQYTEEIKANLERGTALPDR